MTTRRSRRINFSGREFLEAGLNVTDNPLMVPPSEMVESLNVLVGSTLSRRKRGGTEYFNTDASDETANYPDNPKNTVGAVDGDPIRGIYEFWRYDSSSGAPKSTVLVRQDTKIWAIEARTGVATDITGSLSLPTTGQITFQTFEGQVYWTSTNTLEGYNCWAGTGNAIAVLSTAATFDEAISGVTGNVEMSADTAGTVGNAISVERDGVKTLTVLVSDWNTANPGNTVTLDSSNGSDVPGTSFSNMDLSGGKDGLPLDGTPSHIIAHGGRMWAFGVPGFPYRMYYSEFFDAESFVTSPFGTTGSAAEAGSLDLDPFGDPSGINGAVSFQNRLYVFLRRASFEISGNTINNFNVKTLSRQIGCIGHHTIVPVGNDVIYASERGILRLSSTDKAMESDFAFISRPISKIYNQALNRNLESYYHAVLDEQENVYILSCVSLGATTNDIALVYNLQSNIWASTWEGLDARSSGTFQDNGINRVIYGKENGILALGGTEARTDLGVSFTAKFKTGILYPGGEIDLEHAWKSATILASTKGKVSLIVNAYIDSKQVISKTLEIESGEDVLNTTFVLGQSKLGSGVFIPQTIALEGQGYGLQLEVIYNSDDDVEIYGFMVEAIASDNKIGA